MKALRLLRPVLLLLLVLLLLPTCAAVDSNIFDSLSNIFKALADLCSLLGRSFRCFFNPILCVDPTAALNTCIPTTGQCVSTAEQLQAELDAAESDAIVTICATSTITTKQAVVVLDKDGLTICCEQNDAALCILQSSSINDNILDIVADRVALRHLTFRNGRGEYGGNVALDGGSTDHVFTGCSFRNGQAAKLGGNLYVRTEGTLTLDQCTLTNGIADIAGGGLYVSNARAVTITNSRFENNEAVSEGGGFISLLENADSVDFGQKITIDSTVFVDNSADVGGGIFVTRLGRLPALTILNTEFSSNSATRAGGAGALSVVLDTLSFSITNGRSGDANQAPVCLDFLTRFSNTTQPYCVSASGDFVLR